VKVKKVQCYRCSKCGTVRLDRRIANQCCKPQACDCGAALPTQFVAQCKACRVRDDVARKVNEAAAFLAEVEKGVVHTQAAFDALGDDYGVYWGGGPCDRVFASCDEAVDYALQDDRVPPTYFRVTKRRGLTARADEHIEHVAGDEIEDYYVSDEATATLQTFLDEWWEQQGLHTYDVLPGTFVKLPEAYAPETRTVKVYSVAGDGAGNAVTFLHHPPGLGATYLIVPRNELPFNLQDGFEPGQTYAMTAALSTFSPDKPDNGFYIYAMELA
jgi:hypothetical protein